MRSRANTLMSVRRVTERNAGRLTSGVDGEVVLTPQAKARLADRVHQMAEPFRALPVRRVHIPKRDSSTKRRPLGIPDLERLRARRRSPSPLRRDAWISSTPGATARAREAGAVSSRGGLNGKS